MAGLLQKMQNCKMQTQDSIINRIDPMLVWSSKTFNMKKIMSLPLLLTLATVSFCQQTGGQAKQSGFRKIYFQAGTGFASSNGVSVNLGVQAVLKNNWVATISYQSIEMDAKNTPADYEPALNFLFPDPMPANDMKAFNFTVGKYFETGRKTWFTTEAGLSIVSGQELKFAKQPIETGFLYWSSNYAVQKENKSTIGGVLKADFNWAFLPFAGLGAGVYANFNSIQSPVGFEIKLLLGKMNTKRKH